MRRCGGRRRCRGGRRSYIEITEICLSLSGFVVIAQIERHRSFAHPLNRVVVIDLKQLLSILAGNKGNGRMKINIVRYDICMRHGWSMVVSMGYGSQR